MEMEAAKNKIIVALDVNSLKKAESLVEILTPYVGYFKVGLELITAVGAPTVIEYIHSRGGKVFYDGKFNDIPNTVGKASKAVATLNVRMFNIHASSGLESIKAAVANKGDSLVLGVTILTSIDEECYSIFGDTPVKKVLEFAEMLLKEGADGIICSPQELKFLADCRDYNDDKKFSSLIKVTPGIRPIWAAVGDQKRIMTPSEAIKAGADYLVIGRPITNPPKEVGGPVEAAKMIVEEIASAL